MHLQADKIVAPHMVAPGCMLVSMILQVKEELVIGGMHQPTGTVKWLLQLSASSDFCIFTNLRPLNKVLMQ